MSDANIEREILDKGLTAPRVTPADIEANIAEEYFFTAAQGIIGCASELVAGTYAEGELRPVVELYTPTPLRQLTFCVLILRNGFTVTGESACASPENFDAKIGCKIARTNAVNKIWPLMGYELKSKLAG